MPSSPPLPRTTSARNRAPCPRIRYQDSCQSGPQKILSASLSSRSRSHSSATPSSEESSWISDTICVVSATEHLPDRVGHLVELTLAEVLMDGELEHLGPEPVDGFELAA